LEFILYDADTDEPLRPLRAVECVRPNKFNIQARPTGNCGEMRSAKLSLDGPIDVQGRMERKVPYMVFGDDARGDIFGMAYQPGNYALSASIYSGKRLRGNIVVSDEFDFEVKTSGCSR
jgi:hypothetical protein